MPYKTIQQNFANGELNPKMQGRADVDMYYKSAQKMRDVVTTPYGGFVRRPGSSHIAELTQAYLQPGSKNIRLIPFVFNNDQSYLLAITEGKIDIFYKDILQETVSAMDFLDEYIPQIRYAQTADTCIFVHPDFQPLKLIRNTVLSNAHISNNILSAIDVTKPASLWPNYLLKVQSSDTMEMKIAFPYQGYNSNTSYFKITDKFYIGAGFWLDGSCFVNCGIPGEANYTTSFPVGQGDTVYLRLVRTSDGTFTISYSLDDSTYTTGHSFTCQPYSGSFSVNPFIDLSISGYEQCTAVDLSTSRTYIKVNNSYAWTYNPAIWSLSTYTLDTVPLYNFNSSPSVPANVSATPDQLEGTVKITLSGTIDTNLVGQFFEGNGGRVKITSQNGTTLTGYTVIGFYSTDTIGANSWTYTTSYEPVWSTTRGYPCSVTFHGGRLWFGGSKSRPQTVWGSKVGMFDKFDSTSGYDNDAIEFTLDTTELNRITDIYSQKNLLIFTLGGEFVCSTSYNEPITPNNVNAIKQTSNGSWERTHPVDIEGTVMFVERKGQGLMSFAASDNTTDIYNSANSSLINSHLINSPVDIAVERNNLTQQTNYIYLVNSDGTLCVVNLLASQGITGGYTLWKTQGRYKSICVLPDETYVAVERYTKEGYKLLLEKLTDSLVDGEVTDTFGSATSYTNDDFVNKSVDLFLDGKFYGTYQADSDGKITFPEVTGSAKMGYSFRWYVESNFLEIPQLGVGMGRKKRLATMTVRTLDTPELTVNGETQPGGEGIKDIEYYGIGDWDFKPTWKMQERIPCKVNVMAVQMNVNYQVAGDEY